MRVRAASLTIRWRRRIAVTGLLLAATGVQAVAPELVASAGCRDGAPNGAYELRTPDGRLRILGAFAKGHRTGTFLFWAATGDRIAVIPYDDDVKVGTVALWYPPAIPLTEPRRKLEAAFAAGARHGVTRSWYANGRQRTEYLYEHGKLLTAQAWSEQGTPLPEPEARLAAGRDLAQDIEYFASLERTIADNGPRCD
jgi:antitoxin component YwqK of YwqJK toxin-antitoxin module